MTKELDVELLQKKVDELTQKNKLLNEIAVRYADPLKEWDKGEYARKMIAKIHKGYRPVDGTMAIMFKEKEQILPFVEFDHVIEGYPDEEVDGE